MDNLAKAETRLQDVKNEKANIKVRERLAHVFLKT